MINYHLANIVLIDDDSDDRQFFQDALSAVSPKSVLYCYNSCVDAIARLKKDIEKIPEVVFLDLMMPTVDGYECILMIKKDPALKDVPIVVLSGHISTAAVDKLYDLGVSFFISKPPSFNKLKTVLDKMVNTPSMFDLRSRESFFVNEHNL